MADIGGAESDRPLRVMPVGRHGAVGITHGIPYIHFSWNFPAPGWQVRQAGDKNPPRNFSTWENLLDL